MRSRASYALPAVLTVVVSLVALGVAAAVKVGGPAGPGKLGVAIPQETGAGVWDGTYVYSSRDFTMALWIRTQNGMPEMKFRYDSRGSPESFETDWNGKATYYLSGQPGTFEVTYKSRDARRIEGSWHWAVESPGAARIDDATFSVYRAGVGRSAVFKFERMEREVRNRDKVRRIPFSPPPVWTFAKVSKRIDVLYEELPF